MQPHWVGVPVARVASPSQRPHRALQNPQGQCPECDGERPGAQNHLAKGSEILHPAGHEPALPPRQSLLCQTVGAHQVLRVLGQGLAWVGSLPASAFC